MRCGAERCHFSAIPRAVHGTDPIVAGKQVTRAGKYVLCSSASATDFSGSCISNKRGIKWWIVYFRDPCHVPILFYQFLLLLLVGRVAWPDRSESISNEGASSWEGHPSWRGWRVQAGKEVTHCTPGLNVGRYALMNTNTKELSSLFGQLEVMAKGTNVSEVELLWRLS